MQKGLRKKATTNTAAETPVVKHDNKNQEPIKTVADNGTTGVQPLLATPATPATVVPSVSQVFTVGSVRCVDIIIHIVVVRFAWIGNVGTR